MFINLVAGIIKYLYKLFPKKMHIFLKKIQIYFKQANIFRHNNQSHSIIKNINSNIP